MLKQTKEFIILHSVNLSAVGLMVGLAFNIIPLIVIGTLYVWVALAFLD